MAKQEEVKPNPLSLQKSYQPVLVTGDNLLKDYSEGFERKYSQDDNQKARDLSLQIKKNCTLKTFPESRNIIINVHGINGEIAINGSSNGETYHPAFIASQIEVESSKEWPLVLDIYACHIGMGISSEKKSKDKDKSEEIYKDEYEERYKKELPNNCFVILNGGNKESLGELSAQEVERVIDEKDYQKDVPIRYVRKIFHDPQTIKLVYKNEKGKTSFFKHSALKLEDGQKATIKNIKDWTIAGANKFKEDFLREIDDVKEQERIRSELEDEIARLSAKLNDEEVQKLAEKTLLMEACRGKEKRVEHYLTEDFNPNCYTLKRKVTPLHLAVQEGHIKTVETLLSYDEVNINQAYDIGETPISIAVKNGNIKIVKMLLIAASKKGDKEVVEMILNNGFDPNQIIFNTVERILPTVLQKKYEEIAEMLLMTAIQKGYKEIVETLLNNGTDLNQAILNIEETPFLITTKKDYKEIAEMLLITAIQKGYKEVVKILLNEGVNPNLAISNTGELPLCLAVREGQKEIVEILLNEEANPSQAILNTEETPFYIAAKEGKKEIIEMLLEKEADPNQMILMAKETPFFIAVKNGHEEVVKILLNERVDINLVCGIDEYSPLAIASQNGHTKIVEMLLEKGADPKVCTDDRCTPLYLAAQNGHTKIVEMLLTREVDINPACEIYRCTPLFIAIQKGHIEVAKMLLEKKADPDKTREIDECSPIFIATQTGNKKIVEMLLVKGANPNQARKDKCTPVITAIFDKKIEIALLLIEKVDLDKNKWQDRTLEELIQAVITDEVQQKELLKAVQKEEKNKIDLKKILKKKLPLVLKSLSLKFQQLIKNKYHNKT